MEDFIVTGDSMTLFPYVLDVLRRFFYVDFLKYFLTSSFLLQSTL